MLINCLCHAAKVATNTNFATNNFETEAKLCLAPLAIQHKKPTKPGKNQQDLRL